MGAIVTLVCHFFTLIFLARLLEEQALGVYFIALVVSFLLKMLSDLGVDLAFVKQYQEQTDSGKHRLFKSAVAIRLISCTVVSALYVLVERSGVVPFINDISHLTALTLVLYWLHSFRELILRLLQAEQIFSVYAGVQVLAATIKATLIICLTLLDIPSVEAVLMIESFAFAVSIVFAAVKIREPLTASLRARFSGAMDMLRFGYPLFLNAVLNLGNEKVSHYIVAGLGGPVTMAFFGIAEKLSEAGTRLFEAFANVYYPSQAENFANQDSDKAKSLAEVSMLWVTFVITSAIVGFTILREPVMSLLFGETYLSAANAAAMFFAVLLFRSLQTLMGYFGVTAGHKFLPVKVSLVSSVFNIALCLFLFKAYGYEGAIAALVLTQILMNFLYHFWLSKAGLVLSVMPTIKILIVCTVSVTLVYLLRGNLLLSLFVFPLFVVSCIFLVPSLRDGINVMISKGSELLAARQNRAST
jgi:O-antigen/teichoic acid export membrane protein